MHSIMRILSFAPAILAVANAQGVILNAQGTKGSPASLPLQVNLSQADANIINTTEVAQNVVNECGRTLLAGNIDIGENTENQLANKTVTSVTKGSTVAVQIAQGNTQGVGPYTCDIDQTSNASGTSGQVNATVKETDSKSGTIYLAVTMPNNLACIGASTGNICTVRCINSQAFGGCFAVQQTDIAASKNTPGTIITAQTLDGIEAQIAENKLALPASIQANQEATTGTEAQQGVLQADALLNVDSIAEATVSISSTAAAATRVSMGKAGKGGTAAKAGTGKARKNGRKGARAFIS